MLTGASFFGSCETSTRKPLDRLRGAQFVREQRTRKRLGARAGRPLPAVGRQPRETNWPGAPQVRREPSSSLALWMVPRGGVYGSRRSSARPGESWATEEALGRWSFRLTIGRSCALKGGPRCVRGQSCRRSWSGSEKGTWTTRPKRRKGRRPCRSGAGPSLSHRNGYARR